MATLKTTIPLAVASIMVLAILSGCIGLQNDPKENATGKVNLMKKTVKNSTNATNDSVAPSAVSYLQIKRGPNWINWSWDNPQDKDFSYAIIYIDGKFKTNVKSPKSYYNMTGLASNKQYRIGIRTADLSKNINLNWVNGSTSTLPKPKDLLPPDKVWYLEATVDRTWINWTWENPADTDYSYANVYVDSNFAGNVSKSKNYYLLKNLEPDSTHTISVRTVDKNKNINLNSVDDIATTLP
jgi:hypothetical protein